MGLGMIGAIGGLGAGLMQESQFLAKEDAANAELGRQKDLKSWLLAKQREYDIEKDARDWKNEQERAPVKREMKTEDDKASHRAKSEAAAETVDTDATVKQKLTDSGISTPDKDLKKAQADYYNDRGDAAAGKALDVKLDPADKAELGSVQKRAEKLTDAINKAKAEGTWQGTPEQKALESQLASLNLRERAILQKYRGDGAPADPLGIRKPPAGAAPKGGMMGAKGPTNASERKMAEDVKGGMGADPADLKREIAATEADLKKVSDEPSKQALRQHLETLRLDLAKVSGGGSAAPKPAPAPRPSAPAPATAPVSPTEMLGRELDSSRAALKDLRQPQNTPGLKAGAAAREEYAAKVESLRAKIREQEKRYADAVGGMGAAITYRAP